MNSLDPRVNRLPVQFIDQFSGKEELDQLSSFEVFVQPKEGKPFQHEGAVRAADLEMAYVLAKETFTRRFLCTALFVVDTRSITVSPLTEGGETVFSVLQDVTSDGKPSEEFLIFQLIKRGKQHIFLASVIASSAEEAFHKAKGTANAGQTICNLWAIRTRDIRKTTEDEKILWVTLPDKKFRDAANYKGGDKLKDFLERQGNS